MSEIIGLVQNHGNLFYLITFLWTALEGETFVIFAALAAQRGALSIELLFLSAWLGSFCGDQIYFFLGRRFGGWILDHTTKIKPHLEKIFGWVERNSTIFILTYRFMYGIRNVSGVAIGMSHLPWKRFVYLNFAAAGLWAFSFCGFGYIFGGVIEGFGNKREPAEYSLIYEFVTTVLILIVSLIAIRWMISEWRKYRNQLESSDKPQVEPKQPD